MRMVPQVIVFDAVDLQAESAFWAGVLGVRVFEDFYARIGDVHYLFEVKSDKDTPTPLVQAKKAAAGQWARFVTDHGDHGTWRSVLIPEPVVKAAKTVTAILNQTSA